MLVIGVDICMFIFRSYHKHSLFYFFMFSTLVDDQLSIGTRPGFLQVSLVAGFLTPYNLLPRS